MPEYTCKKKNILNVLDIPLSILVQLFALWRKKRNKQEEVPTQITLRSQSSPN